MPPDPRRVQVLFRCALLLPAADRAAFLGPACRDAPDLRARVDELLAAHAETGSSPAHPPPPAPPPDPGDGTRIGPYTLARPLGEGGMGAVWAAEQDPPLRRTVALKVVKPGMDSRAVLARFEAERQALALMDHPNIAKVLDAGTRADGRPYVVMERGGGRPAHRPRAP